MKYTTETKSYFDVAFPVNKNIFLYGKKPQIQGFISQNNSNTREMEQMADLEKSGLYDLMQKEEEDTYLAIPFFKFLTVEASVKSEQLKEIDPAMKQTYAKQNMVYIGKLIHDMYKGLEGEYKPENGFNPIEGGFNPNILKFGNNTDIFLSLHRNDKTQKIGKFWSDDYFGFTKDFKKNLKKYLDGTLTNPGEIEKMDQDLGNTFVGFISKLANYDDENKNQFDGYDSAMKHEFVTKKIGDKLIRSDTSYDI